MVDSTTSPRIEKYKVGRIARVTREDNEQVLKDISNVNQPQPQCMRTSAPSITVKRFR